MSKPISRSESIKGREIWSGVSKAASSCPTWVRSQVSDASESAAQKVRSKPDDPDYIRMAREVFDSEMDSRRRETFIGDSYSIERFAELVAAAEREACALVCEAIPFTYTRMDYDETCLVCATAIRARGVAE